MRLLSRIILLLVLAVTMVPGVFASEEDFEPFTFYEADDGVFLSEVYEHGQTFNHIEIRSNKTLERLYVNFNPEESSDTWEHAYEIGLEYHEHMNEVRHHHDDHSHDTAHEHQHEESKEYWETQMFTSPTQTIQFRIEGDEKKIDGLELRVLFDHEAVKESTFVLEHPDLFAGPVVMSGNRTIITREQWGANPEYMKWLPEIDPETEEPVIDEETGEPEEIGWYGNVIHQGCADHLENFPDELAVEPNPKVKDEEGDWLLWPQLKTKDDPKILFVHHTGSEPKDMDGDGVFTFGDRAATTRAIFKNHSNTRGWGDIGYHYIIDPEGRIYEGRAGGDKVIAGHAACHNAGSIGVSLMGNFQDTQPTQEAVDSLTWLLGMKSRQFGIDPNGASLFRGDYIYNISGHKDVRPTACPGVNMYSRLPDLRLDVGEWVDGQAPLVQRLDYDANFLGETSIDLLPGETRELTIEFENTGNEPWVAPWLNVIGNPTSNQEGVKVQSPVEGKRFVAATALTDQEIKTGETATFGVTLSPTFKANSTSLRFSIVTGSFRLLNGAADIGLNVPEPSYRYELVRSELPNNDIFFQGETIEALVTLKNTGNLMWEKQTISLSPPVNASSGLVLSSQLQEDRVAPGEVGTFKVMLKMPLDRLGLMTEKLAPAMGGVHWLRETSNQSLVAKVNVQEPHYALDVQHTDGARQLLPGERTMIDLTIKNEGNLPLKPSLIDLKLIGHGLLMFKPNLALKETLAPGETASLQFPVQAPYKGGEHSFFVRAVGANGLYVPGGFLKGSIQTENPILSAQNVTESTTINVNSGEEEMVTVAYENTGNTIWRKTGQHPIFLNVTGRSPFHHSDWLNLVTPATLTQAEVKPGEVGEFTFPILPASGGQFQEQYRLVMKGVRAFTGLPTKLAFDVEGEVKDLSPPTSPLLNASLLDATDPLPNIPEPVEPTDEFVEGELQTLTPPDWLRIKINHDTEDKSVSVLTANSPFKVTNGHHQVLFSLTGGDEVTVEHVGNDVLKISDLSQDKYVSIARIVPDDPDNGVVTVLNMDRTPGWTDEFNDNAFRGNMELRWLDEELVHIGENDLEKHYLPGLAEFASSTHPNKRDAIITAARSYVYHYSVDEYIKFPGKPYHGSDSPAEFQKYLGYHYELRSPVVGEAARRTEGRMITYSGEVIKPPYHSSNDGFTKDPMEVWGWSEPYLTPVPDPDCEGMEQRGHGVGMSGCGSEARAQRGDDYITIIEHYYPGATVTKVY